MELTPKTFGISLLILIVIMFGSYQWGRFDKGSSDQGQVENIKQILKSYETINISLRAQRDSALNKANEYYIQKELLKKTFKLNEATDKLDQATNDLMREHTESEKDSIEQAFIDYLTSQQQ